MKHKRLFAASVTLAMLAVTHWLAYSYKPAKPADNAPQASPEQPVAAESKPPSPDHGRRTLLRRSAPRPNNQQPEPPRGPSRLATPKAETFSAVSHVERLPPVSSFPVSSVEVIVNHRRQLTTVSAGSQPESPPAADKEASGLARVAAFFRRLRIVRN